jgi:hypothetical protein
MILGTGAHEKDTFMRPIPMRLAAACLAALALMSAPLAAQTDAFGVEVVRGPAAEPVLVESTVWIDPAGFSDPVMITRGGIRVTPARPVVGVLSNPLRFDGIQGIVKLPIFPRQVVWWDWTREYRRYYAGRVW